MSFESFEQAPTKQSVIESLRATPGDFALLGKYLEAKEAAASSALDNLNINIETAEIYRDAGLREAAHDAYTDALTQAWQMGEDELYEKIQDELEKLQ